MEKSPLLSFMSVALSMMNERINNSVIDNTEEFLEAIKKGEVKNNQPCVCNACVTCTATGPKCRPVHLEKNNRQVEIGDLSQLTRKDIKLATPFEKCTKTADGKCEGSTTYIEGREWQMADQSSSHGPGLGTLNHLTAYMVCMKGPGVIYFTSAGQGLKSYFNKLDGKYTEAKANVPVDFECELRQKGFPEGYIKYLMILHEKYPKWQFEPVITNVDYQEFLQYQIDSQIKCANIKEYPVYCTDTCFTKEEAGKYYYATNDAIRFFSHPYSLLQRGDWKYENALQFLRMDQQLPKDYAEQVVPAILENENTEIIDAILNSNSCFDSVFLAAIYSVEHGPHGETYKGKEVYNLFNINAVGGKSNSLEFAYENQWFSPEECIKGSEKTFQSYLDRGQNTLYALDWDFQSYSRDESLNQYAVGVNDAETKAIMLAVKGGQKFNLDQEFIFNIPVYDNIPSFSEDGYEAFPDPNKVARTNMQQEQ